MRLDQIKEDQNDDPENNAVPAEQSEIFFPDVVHEKRDHAKSHQK